MKYYITCFLITALLATTSCKKGERLPPVETTDSIPEWRVLTTTNSILPNQQINSIAIGKNDVVWIGTQNGLARLAGNRWTVYNTLNSALPSNTIQALAMQNDGTVWVGTSEGLAKFDGISWSVYTQASAPLPAKAIMSLAYDTIYHQIWAGTEQGIIKIDAAGKWEVHDETGGELPLSMITDQDGALWIGAHEHVSFRGSIKKFYNGAWQSYQLASMGYESAFPYAISIAEDRSVVALLSGTVVRTVIKFKAGNWTELQIPEDAIGLRTLLLQGDQIWLGGLALSTVDDINTTLISLPDNPSGILSMAVDSKGDKWLGTTSGGIAVYHEKKYSAPSGRFASPNNLVRLY